MGGRITHYRQAWRRYHLTYPDRHQVARGSPGSPRVRCTPRCTPPSRLRPFSRRSEPPSSLSVAAVACCLRTNCFCDSSVALSPLGCRFVSWPFCRCLRCRPWNDRMLMQLRQVTSAPPRARSLQQLWRGCCRQMPRRHPCRHPVGVWSTRNSHRKKRQVTKTRNRRQKSFQRALLSAGGG